VIKFVIMLAVGLFLFPVNSVEANGYKNKSTYSKTYKKKSTYKKKQYNSKQFRKAAKKHKSHGHWKYTGQGTACLPASIKQVLNTIRNKFGQIVIISAHRPGARIRKSGKPSLHASCRAVDFNPPRGQYRPVLNWLKANWNGGVGSYSGKHNHIHIDTGGKYRWHN